MKKLYIFVGLSLVLLGLFMIGCDSELHDISIPQDELSTSHKINSSDFEYTSSSDRAINTDIGVLSSIGHVRFFDGYIYVLAPSMIYRYNPETGNTTTLCDAPTCQHNTVDCPFIGISYALGGLFIYDNNVYYHQDYMYTVQEDLSKEPEVFYVKRYVQYDIEKRQLTPLNDFESGIKSENFFGNFRYYLETVVNEDQSINYNICKQDLTTFKTTTIKNLGSVITGISYVDDERLYLSNGVDLYFCELSNLEIDIPVYKGSIYDCIHDENDIYMLVNTEGSKTLMRIDNNGNNLTVLSDNVGYFCLTDEHIYFRKDDKITLGTTAKGEAIQVPDNKIYRLPKGGGKTELVFEFPPEMSNYFLSYFLVDGNYLYCPYGYYDSENDELYESFSSKDLDFLRINLLTQELYYIEY